MRLIQCEQKKLKDLKQQFWGVLHFFMITGKAARTSQGAKF